MNGKTRRRGAALALALGCVAVGHLRSQASLKVDPSWLNVDSAGSKVEFAVVAGLTPLNGGMNFNGADAGGLTLTVPLRWTVVLHFRNNDQMLPHSAMVIAAVVPVPVSGAEPAFEHATTSHPEQGFPPDGREDVRFVANRVGSYLIYCAVPGHGAAGMWIRLEVSGTARTAVVAVTSRNAP